MEREIKFRAWLKEEKRMIVDEQYLVPLWVTNKGILRLLPNFEENYYEICNGSDYVIMQFTGLYDRNGKEIYEGDIVKKGDTITVCKWNSTHSCFAFYTIGGFYLNYSKYNQKSIKIIGNIYDNPELIEKEE